MSWEDKWFSAEDPAADDEGMEVAASFRPVAGVAGIVNLNRMVVPMPTALSISMSAL